MPVRVARIDTTGNDAWTPPAIEIKTGPTDTARLDVAASTQPFAAWVWQDDSGGGSGGSIKAQNIDFDGHPGPPGGVDIIFADGFES
jgi:hypothetical protein